MALKEINIRPKKIIEESFQGINVNSCNSREEFFKHLDKLQEEVEQALYDYIKTGDLQELINLNFFIGIVFAMILVISCFSYSHINFLKRYSTKNFEISRSGKITDDVWFIIIYINVGGVFNVIVQYFIVSDLLYRFISLYLVQTTLLYFMLKMNCCGYKLIPQLVPQVTPPSQHKTKKGLKRGKRENRLLSKLAYAQRFVGDTSPRTAAYSNVCEDSSTGITHKLPAEVEFQKKSN